MYNTLPLGPLSLPTAPLFALLATIVALDVAGRAGRRFRLHPDDVWNTGLLALAAGLIVARLWTIIQFWPVYQAEPMLAFSLRPSGFAVWPGLIAAVLTAYAFLIWRSLEPGRVLASLLVGIAAGAVAINVSTWLTGASLGMPSDLPWATRHFLEHVHPVGLYRALGMTLVLAVAWSTILPERPWRTTWLVILGSALVHLVADAFLRDPGLLGQVRRSQLIALVVALLASIALAREARSVRTASVSAAPAPDAGLAPQSDATP